MRQDILSDISEVKHLIESRTKFISLTGLSGILSGIYALIGAYFAYNTIYNSQEVIYYDFYKLDFSAGSIKLMIIALTVLILALSTSWFLSARKAKKEDKTLWTKAGQRMILNGSIPLITGGIFIILLIIRSQIDLVAPSCLIFYGIALVLASNYTYQDVKWLGIIEIILGLINMLYPGHGLMFWSIGFGIMHIIYGTLMYFKYERTES